MSSRKEKQQHLPPPPKNQFAALDMSSESDSGSEVEVAEPQPRPQPQQHREWKLTPEEQAKRAASGPPSFSKKSRRNKQQKEEGNGWVSIQWTKPQFKDDDDKVSSCSEKEILKEVEEEAKSAVLEDVQIPIAQENEFPSLMNRGSAVLWAEKIRASLERAEAARRPSPLSQPTEDFVEGLGRLSFFRSKE